MEAKLIMSTLLNKKSFYGLWINNNFPVELRVCKIIHNFQSFLMGPRLLFNPGEVSGICNGLCR